MSYSADNVISVRADATVAHLPNNLTFSNERVGYVGKNSFRMLRRADFDGASKVAPTTKLSVLNAGTILQAKWVTVAGSSFLALAMRGGFQVWNDTAESMLLSHSLPVAEDGGDGGVASKAAFCTGIAVSNSFKQIAFGASTGGILLCEVANATTLAFLADHKGHDAPVAALAADEAGVYIASGDDDGTIKVWQGGAMACKASIPYPAGVPCTGAVIRGDVWASTFLDGKIRIGRASSASVVAEVDAHARPITGICLHPACYRFATVGEDARLNIWDLPEAAAGGNRVELAFNCEVEDHMLTGVEFVPQAATAGGPASAAAAGGAAGSRNKCMVIVTAYGVYNIRSFLES